MNGLVSLPTDAINHYFLKGFIPNPMGTDVALALRSRFGGYKTVSAWPFAWR